MCTDKRIVLSDRSAAGAPALSRQLLGVLIALLVLGQPLLCIGHCRMSAPPAHHSTPSPDDPLTFFLCELPEPTAAQEVFVLAYWPGLPTALLIVMLALQLAARLLAATPSQHTLPSWAPLTPPPR